jgi:DNA topoisomerase I
MSRVRLCTEPAEPFPLSHRNASALTDTVADILPGLHFVSDHDLGIARLSTDHGFAYQNPNGTFVDDESTLHRIKSLAIPPAWTAVWICPDPHGHIQAVGRDARGRKQYRYHPLWRESRDEAKYSSLLPFGESLADLRERVEADLSLRGLPREKVLAVVVTLLDQTLIRVGNLEYARTNNTYGLTTLKNRHLKIEGATLRFKFRGKSGKVHDIGMRNARLARLLRRCQELPGQHLFQYVDSDGATHAITSSDVNAYLSERADAPFTAKHFRTWGGTVIAAGLLRELDLPESERQTNHVIVETVKQVAERLGNTPAVCRKCYVHPDVLDAFREGRLRSLAEGLEPDESAPLSADERLVLRLLQSAQSV